jgi:RNA recognition motif-containing protein
MFSDESSTSPTDPENLLPRGPPRKPKQSGFALWVGNLPQDVLLEELKDFFAIEGLESIFLIRKSNCAFVNYDTEEACSLALSMFNDKCTQSIDDILTIQYSRTFD